MPAYNNVTFIYQETAAQNLANFPVSTGDKFTGLQALKNYLSAIASGSYNASIAMYQGAVPATATIVFASTGPTNGQTCTILGTTFTAVTSGATGNQFDISDTPATVATNLVNAINGSATAKVTGSITASSGGTATVTLTAKVPGTIGNGLVIANVNLSNTTFNSFSTNGTNGTSVTMDFT